MDRLAQIKTLLIAEEEGTLDRLECPDCHARTVSVRYTEPQEGVYRLWFLCSECTFQQRVQLAGKPKHFSIDRVDERLQAYDTDIMEQCHFKLKPNNPRSS
jgi:RNase P subunit RPR2